MVGRSPHPQCIGNRVAPCPCIGKDDGLSPESFRGGPLVLLGGHLLDGRDLLFALQKEEIPFQSHRAFSVLHKAAVQFFCQRLGGAYGSRQVQELCLRCKIFQPCDHAIETVPPVCILEHLDFIDHHGRNICHLLPAADHGIHPFIGADDNGRLRVPVPHFPGLGKVKPAHPGEEPGPGNFPVPVRKPFIFLVCEGYEGYEEEHPSPPLKVVLNPRHLTNECLATRCCGYHQQVLAVQQSRFHGELLGGHELGYPACLNKLPREGEFIDRSGSHHRVRFKPVVERCLHREFIGLQRREYAVEIAEGDKKVFKMGEPLHSQPSDVGHFTAQFALPALKTDLLTFAERDAVFLG